MTTHISVPPQLLLERILTLEIVRVTERAAVSAARLRGHGNEKAADQAAVDAMRRELNKLPIEGTVVIGEGERDEAPMLYIGEKVGMNAGPQVDIAVDPLEGTTLCAKNMPGAIATMAMADGGTLLHAPDVDMYIGTGGAPEGVLAAAALRCIGGQMQCRLILDSEEKRERASKMGVADPRMIYGVEDMIRGDCLFAATGVTTGSLLTGVKFRKDVIETETVVMRSVTGTVRYIKADHRQLEKFHLD